jgi:hypothetical protein
VKTPTKASNDTYGFVTPVDSVNVPKCPFAGKESNIITGDQSEFAGHFTNSKIQFTFNSGPKNTLHYTGTISGSGADETITLTTPSGKVVLKR